MNIRKIFNDFHPIVKLIFDGFFTLIVFFVAFVIGLAILSSFFGISYADFANNIKISGDINVLRASQILYSLTLFFIPAVVISFFYTSKTFYFFQINRFPAGVNFLLVFFLVIFSLPLVNSLALFNTSMQLPVFMENIEQMMLNAEQNAKVLVLRLMSVESAEMLLLNLFIVAFLPSIGEELFFRGLIQKHTIEWTKSEHLGVFIAAFLFSAIHFQFFTFLPRLFLGILLGYLFVWSKSLWMPVFAHFVNNALAVLVAFFYFKTKGTIPENIDSFGTDSSTFLYTIFSLIAFTAILFLIKKNEDKKLSE